MSNAQITLLRFVAAFLCVIHFAATEAADRLRTLTDYAITSAGDFPARDPRDWKLLGSTNGGLSWTVLDVRTNEAFLDRLETRTFNVKTNVPCNAFRLEIESVRDPQGANSIQIAEIQLKGDLEGKHGVDLRPGSTDLVRVHGENAPWESRRKLFDGDFATKWLDFSVDDRFARSSWVEWRYDTGSGEADAPGTLQRLLDVQLNARAHSADNFLLNLNAVVHSIDRRNQTVVLQDATAAVLLRMIPSMEKFEPGARIAVSGKVRVVRNGSLVELQPAPLIEDDGVHTERSLAEPAQLSAGKQRFRLEYFNALDPGVLTVSVGGPSVPQQAVRDQMLFSAVTNSAGDVSWVPGVRRRIYLGEWQNLPDFETLPVEPAEIVRNFTLSGAPRKENVAAFFDGFIEVPESGVYTFEVRSDDGVRLFAGPQGAHSEQVGTSTNIPPVRVTPGQVIRFEAYKWSVVEGEVTLLAQTRQGWLIELMNRTGKMHVLVPENWPPALYLNGARVRVEGICVPLSSGGDYRTAGELICPGLDHISVLNVGAAVWGQSPVDRPGSLQVGVQRYVHLLGRLSAGQQGHVFLAGTSALQIVSPAGLDFEGDAEVLGLVKWNGTNALLSLAAGRQAGSAESEAKLPTLTSIEQVRRLSHEEADLHYPVHVRAVVTCAWGESSTGIVQDDKYGIFVEELDWYSNAWAEPGDYVEINGVTTGGGFAPNIKCERVVRLGKMALPEPIRPTWSQLMNGSVDCQFGEIRGLVTAATDQRLSVMMRDGMLNVLLPEADPAKLGRYTNALVRLRGVITAYWDDKTRKVIPGDVFLNTYSISVEQEAPTNLFSVPAKEVAALLQFDPAADEFRRVKISGQVVGRRAGEFFVVNGTNGLRVLPKLSTGLQIGDLVEAAGFPRSVGPSILLRDAFVRKTGRAKVQAAQTLDPNHLLDAQFDATRVHLVGRLLGTRREGRRDVLEVQSGSLTFLGVLASEFPSDLPPLGSTVALSGVYVAHGTSERRDVDRFELLMASPDDLTVVARPSWWTLKHTLGVVSGLSLTLIAAAAWIIGLRKVVHVQTKALRAEVAERTAAEARAERAREAAEQASRAKSQFLAAMSHEIRTPMNGVIGMAHLLLDSGLTPSQRELAETVNSSGEALLSIINDILDFSKIEAGKMRLESAEFNLHQVISTSAELLAPRAQQKGLELHFWIEPTVPARVKGDAGRVRQILLNLLGNAVKFTESGEVFIEVKALATAADKARLEIAIHDSGIGIDPADQERLFSAFEQVDQSNTRRYGGTGLGLVISQRLIQEMKGDISVASARGMGSTFRFNILLELVDPAKSIEPVPAEIHGSKLLIVSSLARTREIASKCGETLGLSVLSCATLEEARSKVASLSERDFLLLDGEIDKLLGFLAETRSRSVVPAVILTTLRDSARIGSDSPRTLPLTKPVSGQKLADVLRRLGESTTLPNDGAAVAPAKAESPVRILIAEDNLVNQRVAVQQLRKLGYKADVANNGQEAFNMSHNADYDLIFMDCQMPDVDGFEATRRIRALPGKKGAVPIIAMTANALSGDRDRCLEAGMTDYISKPVSLKTLSAALERAAAV